MRTIERVALVTTSYPRSADDPSGHFVRAHALALARAGAEVHVVAPGGSLCDRPREEAPRLTVHRAGGGALFAWPGAAARAREAPWRLAAAAPFAAGVIRRVRELGPIDRAVAHWIVPSAWPLLALATAAPLAIVAHGADVRLLCAAPARVRRTIVRALLDRGARLTFAARASLEALAGALPPELERALRAASQVEPPPIDVPDVAGAARVLRASLDLAPGVRVAVVACRLVATKRVDVAIEAARASASSLRLVVVGDGPERARLAAAAAGAPVTFTGALPRRDALGWIAAADVLVHPSAVEAAPTAVREARALGVPVVACAAGDVEAWAAADAGIRIAAPDARAIARAIASAC